MMQLVRKVSFKRILWTVAVTSAAATAFLFWRSLATPEQVVSPRWGKVDPYQWVCSEGTCLRLEMEDVGSRTSLASCRMRCGPLPLWPRPTGQARLGRTFSSFRLDRVQFSKPRAGGDPVLADLLSRGSRIFLDNLSALVEARESDAAREVDDLIVSLAVEGDTDLTLRTDESYVLRVVRNQSTIVATVSSKSYFGARHGLETLSQLVWWDYDSSGGTLYIVSDVMVVDRPVFPYRGLMLDTSRNFVRMESLRTTIDAMAACKLNTFHWHISDSQSFPLYLPRVPNMALYGAYSSRQVYSDRDVAALVDYARVRGVRVLVEVDTPAHTGAGWQWGASAMLGNLTLCYRSQPWQEYCGEPPCGQLNPLNNNTYVILEQIYSDLVELTSTKDLFHVGGDEVDFRCWAMSQEILSVKNGTTTTADLFDYWGRFQMKALERLTAANGNTTPKAVVIWSSKLTQSARVSEFLSNKVYVVQVWGPSDGKETQQLLDGGYRVILSHVDAWYLDCGFGPWRGSGAGPCGPMASWQSVYNHRPWKALRLRSGRARLVLGGEACLWTETAGENGLDTRLWPHGAALAERLWTDPDTVLDKPNNDKSKVDWNLRTAYMRLSHHRERLVRRGVRPAAMWPEWCHQNPSQCLVQLDEIS